MPKPQYTQKFRSVWLKDPELKDWLLEFKSGSSRSDSETSVAKCKVCHCILANKFSDLKSHAQTKKHKSNSKLILGRTQPQIPFVREAALESSKIAECRLSLFVACHTSIITADHLVSVCKNAFQGDAALYLKMHRTKCTAILKNVIGPFCRNKLREDIAESPFSLLVDESTDISVQKYLGLCIIYFSKELHKIVSTCLELSPLETCDANGITNCIKGVLAKYHLKIKNLQGLGTDNASVMVGINNGVYQKLKVDCPNLILIRCVCHSLQLAVSAAANELPKHLEFLIRETYDWFARSTSRQLAYKTLYQTINDDEVPLKITQACATRWLSIETAVSRIHSQWLELKTHFDIMRQQEKCYSADLLFNMYKDDLNYAYLCFLKPILGEVNKVNKNFEGKNVDQTKLLSDLLNLLNSLTAKVTTPNSKFNVFLHNIDDYFDRNCYLGYLFEIQIKKMKDSGYQHENTLRSSCHQFLKELIRQIANRVPENVKLLKTISMFSVGNVLKTQKDNIVEILTFFKKTADQISSIENQWSKIHLMEWENISDTCKFWIEVLGFKDSEGTAVFKELADFAISLLTLPHSNADVERLFSSMNLVKTKIRNRLSLDTLNSILTIRAEMKRQGYCCHDFPIHQDILHKIKTAQSYESEDTENEDWDIFI